MDITKIIDKYGAELSKGLKIATTEVYDKLLWYTRINGVIGLVSGFLAIVYWGLTCFVIHKICKKIKVYDDPELSVIIYMFGFLISLVIFVSICALEPINNNIKIVAPEYWIIEQVINKVK